VSEVDDEPEADEEVQVEPAQEQDAEQNDA